MGDEVGVFQGIGYAIGRYGGFAALWYLGFEYTEFLAEEFGSEIESVAKSTAKYVGTLAEKLGPEIGNAVKGIETFVGEPGPEIRSAAKYISGGIVGLLFGFGGSPLLGRIGTGVGRVCDDGYKWLMNTCEKIGNKILGFGDRDDGGNSGSSKKT
jgi:hypothetical protein